MCFSVLQLNFGNETKQNRISSTKAATYSFSEMKLIAKYGSLNII